MIVGGEVGRVNLYSNSTANIDGILSVGAGGIRGPNEGEVRIRGGVLTSSVGMIDVGITGAWPGSTFYIESSISDNGSRRVGMRISGEVWGSSGDRVPYGLVVITGKEANTFTGDLVIDKNLEVILDKEFGLAAVGDMYVTDRSAIVSHRSHQISHSSIVTLRRNSAFEIRARRGVSVTESFHRLVVEEGDGFVSFFRSPDEMLNKTIYLDDLLIKDDSLLTVRFWVDGLDRILVRKDSEHLKESLSRIWFEGYGEAQLVEYDKDYWEISGLPEPATYGAIFGLLGTAAVAWRRRRAGNPFGGADSRSGAAASRMCGKIVNRTGFKIGSQYGWHSW